MAKPYKALQNKALHKGAYLAYVIAEGTVYTTNGQIMIARTVDATEVKATKDQHDKRDVETMADVSTITKTLRDWDTAVVIKQVEHEWTTDAGLKVLQSRGYHKPTNKEFVVNVQAVYVDYVNAVMDVEKWYMTDKSVFATDAMDNILAVIAPVNEEYKEDK